MKLSDFLFEDEVRLFLDSEEEAGIDGTIVAVLDDYGLCVKIDELGDYKEIIPFSRIKSIGIL